MILLKYVYNIQSIASKERRWCEDNHGEKNHYDATTTEQLTTVDLRCRVTTVKMLVSQSVSAVLIQSV